MTPFGLELLSKKTWCKSGASFLPVGHCAKKRGFLARKRTSAGFQTRHQGRMVMASSGGFSFVAAGFLECVPEREILQGLPVCIKVEAIANYLEVFGWAQSPEAVWWMAGLTTNDASGTLSESNAALAHRSQVLRSALVRFFQRHVRDVNEADDLVQEVFLRVVRRGHCHQLEHLDGYIFQTATSVLKDRGRRRKTRFSDHHIPFDPELHAGTEFAPDRSLMGREALNAAGVILLELPEKTRRVFVLRRLEELSYSEIGLRLEISVSAVEKHMLRAVRHLASRIGGDT